MSTINSHNSVFPLNIDDRTRQCQQSGKLISNCQLKIFTEITFYLVRGAFARRVRAQDAILSVSGRGHVGTARGAKWTAVLETDHSA